MIDGDTIEIHEERIRLHGIDAPESGQHCRDGRDRVWRCGQKAAFALDAKIRQHIVSCKIIGTDRYQRMIGVCEVGGADLSAWMVSEGLAVAYRKYSDEYVAEEEAAERSHLGLWQGRFTRPDIWRKGGRLDDDRRTRADLDICKIKGNISSKGELIYHLPGMKWYNHTRISMAKGERWFCSEADARAAGWRKAR